MEVSDNENSQPPPDDKTSTSIIQESVVPERCDFILQITAEQFNSLFPKSEDDHGKNKMTPNESYKLAQKYCKKQQRNVDMEIDSKKRKRGSKKKDKQLKSEFKRRR